MHRATCALIVFVCTFGASCARRSPEPAFTLKQIGPNAWAAFDNPKATSPAASNAGFVIGDDGVVVIDTFSTEDAAKQLLAEIQQRTKLPVKFVVNTHYHFDHVAGNGVFAKQGATVLAQRNVRGWIHTENLRLIGDFLKPWVETLDEITAMSEPGYTFVPGHGAIGDAKDVAAFGDYLTTLRTLVSEARTQGKAGDALVQSIVPRLKEKFGQWEFAEPVAKNNILETDAEMRGMKRIPLP
jgi:glyoxylase-like metal-dependent hydrolase (beta-lactamase superfamily II)